MRFETSLILSLALLNLSFASPILEHHVIIRQITVESGSVAVSSSTNDNTSRLWMAPNSTITGTGSATSRTLTGPSGSRAIYTSSQPWRAPNSTISGTGNCSSTSRTRTKSSSSKSSTSRTASSASTTKSTSTSLSFSSKLTSSFVPSSTRPVSSLISASNTTSTTRTKSSSSKSSSRRTSSSASTTKPVSSSISFSSRFTSSFILSSTRPISSLSSTSNTTSTTRTKSSSSRTSSSASTTKSGTSSFSSRLTSSRIPSSTRPVSSPTSTSSPSTTSHTSITRKPTTTETLSTTTSRSTTTISGTEPVAVAPGTVVIGGPGGGIFTVDGVATAVAAGEEVTVAEPADTTSSSSKQSSSPRVASSITSSSVSTTSSAPASTSSVPTGPTAPYLIFPVESATEENQTALIDLLAQELSSGNYEATNLTSLGIQFVSANLTVTQVSDLNSSTLVGEVIPDFYLDPKFGSDDPVIASGTITSTIVEATPTAAVKRRLEHDVRADEGSNSRDNRRSDWIDNAYKTLRSRASASQVNALDELKVFSQPPGTKLADIQSYSYDDSAGEDITVYVLDSGYYTKNSEYTGMKTAPRWIFAGSQKTASKQEDRLKSGHGTCCGSKINGPNFGIAKSANLVIVKADSSAADTLDGLAEIYNDVVARDLQGKAVVNLSRGFQTPVPENIQKFLRVYIKQLIAADVVFIAATGNDERDLEPGQTAMDINAYPQLLASDALPIINVGASDNEGNNASFSMGGPLVTVMAPGVGITCGANSFFSNTQTIDGTSFAAPAVAGLAAYLLALGQYPQLYQKGSVAKNMRDLLQQMSHSRITGGFPVVFNGEGASCSAAGQSKRDFGGACIANSTQSASASALPSSTGMATITTSIPASTTASATATVAPTATPLFTLTKSVTNGQINCFPTSDWAMTAGTYGFEFITSSDIVVQIGKDSSNPSYYQGLGSGNGTFYADYSGSLSICATNNGDTAKDLVWNVYATTDIPNLVMPVLGSVVAWDLTQTVEVRTQCFPTSGFTPSADTIYTFSYNVGNDTVLMIGDDVSEPHYFQGKGPQNPGKSGSMYLMTANSPYVCFKNEGSSSDVVSFSIHSRSLF